MLQLIETSRKFYIAAVSSKTNVEHDIFTDSKSSECKITENYSVLSVNDLHKYWLHEFKILR